MAVLSSHSMRRTVALLLIIYLAFLVSIVLQKCLLASSCHYLEYVVKSKWAVFSFKSSNSTQRLTWLFLNPNYFTSNPAHFQVPNQHMSLRERCWTVSWLLFILLAVITFLIFAERGDKKIVYYMVCCPTVLFNILFLFCFLMSGCFQNVLCWSHSLGMVQWKLIFRNK